MLTHRIPDWRGAVVVAVGFTSVILLAWAAVWDVTILLVPAGVAGLILTLRYPQPVALLLLLIGPLLTSTFKLGQMSLDNAMVIAGLGLVAVLAVVRRQLPFNRWSTLPLVLAAAIFITGTLNGAPNWEACLRFVSLGAVPWVVSDAPRISRVNFRILLSVMSVGALSVFSQPLIGYPHPYKDTENTGLRYGGLFGHPNFAAYALSLSILYVLSQKLNAWRVAYLLIAGGAVLTTGSITATLMLVAAVGVLLARNVKRLMVGLLVLGIFVATAGQTLLSRLDFVSQTSAGPAASGNSGTWRLGQWQRVLRLLEGNETTGIGWGEIPLKVGNNLGAHNAYVQLAVELGWAALVAVLLIVAASLMAALRNRLHLVAWIYVLATSMSDPVLFYPSSMTLLLFLLAASPNHKPAPGEAPGLAREEPPSRGRYEEVAVG